MFILLFLLLLAVPIAELWVIVAVARSIGVIETLALLFGLSVAGAWLLKQQGMATWARMQDALSRGEVPTHEVTDGALILLGGALLLTPGFLTDAVGLLFLLPPTRAVLKGTTRRLMARWARRRMPGAAYSARVVRVERHEPGASPKTPSLETGPASVEDDSPDRG